MTSYLVGVAASIPAVLVWHIPRPWWQALDRPGTIRLQTLLRSVPALTVGAWVLFGVFFPIDAAIEGAGRGRGFSAAELVALVLCAVPWLTVALGGWPLWLVPPGARDRHEAAYFIAHWAGMFSFVTGVLAFNFALRGNWVFTASLTVITTALALVQFTLLRRRSRPGR